MKNNGKKKTKKNKILAVIVIILVVGVVIFFQTRPKLVVVKVVKEMKEYSYYLESNATKVYKKYYEELENVLKKENNDSDYVKIVSKMFLTDFYTLNNKVTNKNIGGIQFVHTNLKDKFIEEASNSIYKYVENNLYGKRKQTLPEVSSVSIDKIENVKYNTKDYKDENGYKVTALIKYKKDLKYPTNVTLFLIHEGNKISIVEIK